jgi:tRNA(Ile)-lysidine synthase
MRVSDGRTAPFTAESFALLMAPFAPFERQPVLAVAVSGGRDSLALALLVHDWAKERGGRAFGLIVDHGLRAGSEREAAVTGDVLLGLGVSAEILRWTGPKPGHGIQEAARAARYRLLFEACRRHAILHLLVGHHADDQAETIAMRADRASGVDGLAGMAALVEHAEARLLRPLLSVPRTRLSATLQARGVTWIDDPSNTDLRFERARLRRAGRGQADFGHAEASARTAREIELARSAVEALEFDGEAAAIDGEAFRGLDASLGARLLSRIVQAVGGRDHPPRRDRLARAAARVFEGGPRGKSGKSQDFTLAACRLLLRQGTTRRRPSWIVRPENGKKDPRKTGQPLIPAAFFACGGATPPHVQ